MREINCFTFKISGRRDFQICRVLEKYNRYLLFVAPPSSPLILADQGGRNICHLFPLINLTQKRELKIRKHPIYIYIYISFNVSPPPPPSFSRTISLSSWAGVGPQWLKQQQFESHIIIATSPCKMGIFCARQNFV